MRVAHLTSVHVPWDTRILYHECASVASAGYDVVLIATEGKVSLPNGVRLRTVPLPRNRFERMTRTVWQIYRAACEERADIYHFHDPELMGIGLLLRMRGARVVFDVHEDIPYDIADKVWLAPPLRRPVAALAELVLRGVQRWYSAVITATPAIARRFRNPRTVVVHNYPAPEELGEVGAVEFSQRPRSVVYLGSITELRCVEEMVRAMATEAVGPDTRLHLAGPFEDEELERRVRALPGWDRVDYSGYFQRGQMPELLGSARAGLLLFRRAANHDEAMPNKLFEYLGAGLPVIISNTMQCADLVREHDCGIVVDPRDIAAVGKAIQFLIDNPATAQAMGRRGRALVCERYQWTSEANKLTKLYAEIA